MRSKRFVTGRLFLGFVLYMCLKFPRSRRPKHAYLRIIFQAVESGAAGKDGARGERPAGLRPRQHGPLQVGAQALAAAPIGEGGGRAGAGSVLPDAGA